MLQILRNPETATETVRPAVRPRRVLRHVIITVAKARHYPTRRRADLAAQYLAGISDVKRTWALAEFIFRVHAPSISAAIDRLDSTAVEPAIETAWRDASAADQIAFISNHLGEVWKLVDQATA